LVLPQNIVLEVKTTGAKNLESWNTHGIPKAYLKQAQLYTYLMDLSKFAIVATFVEPSDYVNPKAYPINERKTKTWFFDLNRAQTEDDIKIVKEWYYKYTKLGVSPKYNDFKDRDLIAFLECHNKEEWITLQEKWKIEGKISEK
jgi:hypothetical protein